MLEFLKNAAKNGKLVHGYLFYNGTAEEMKNVALQFAEFLKTDKFDIQEAGTSVDQIREIRKNLSLSPYNSFYKFVIIDKAETMNNEASNALLKTLEEPLGNAILILITSNPDLLLKTIISRLQKVKFKSLSLNKVAKDFINEDSIGLLKKPLNDIFKYIEKITKSEDKNINEVFTILNSWLFWFREKLANEEDKVKENLKIIKEIQKTKDLISNTNVNKRLALENLVLCINNY
jgi:Asp-tRNA(Asn)/Glu-tRNA(Gln) amidotransferase C subunit